MQELVQRLDALGYAGDSSFEVFNDDYQQMPPPLVLRRARLAAQWLSRQVQRTPVAGKIAHG
jgi:hypothetical protein